MLLTAGGAAAQTSETGARPFHEFRKGQLEYPGPEDSAAAREDLEEVLVGWFGPADPDHPLHGDLWVAASLAVERANLDGGWNGLPFRLVPRWAENVWGSGVSQVARLVYEDRVWAILGSVDGTATHLVEQIVAKARLPLISPVSTDESVNLAGVPWMFSVVPGDHLWAPTLTSHLLDSIGDGSFALITVTDHDSRLATQALLETLDRSGRGPAFRLDLQPEATSLAFHLDRIGVAELAAMVLIAGPESGPQVLAQLRAAGFEGTIFAAPQLARRTALAAAGQAAEGLRVPLLYSPSTARRETRLFVELLRERTGVEPDWAAAHTFDATRILLAAIRAAGLSRTAIREAFVEISPWQGITGVIEWDPTGQNMRPVTTMATVRDGRLVPD